MARLLGLENVVKTAEQYPESFFIPSEKERRNQKKGDSVRLHFILENPGEEEPRAERIWVTVTQEHGLFKSYKGTLQTNPLYIENLAAGQEVTFTPDHVARTIIKEGDPRWIDSSELKALVSEQALEKGKAIRFLYREAADRKEDSGWRMFSGEETEEYTNDPKHIRIMNVGFLLDSSRTAVSMRESPSPLAPRPHGECLHP